MNWEAISAISDILAALAVVVTLVYLAIQIRRKHFGDKVDDNASGTRSSGDVLRFDGERFTARRDIFSRAARSRCTQLW